MKKVIALCLSLVFLAALISCASGDEKDGVSTAPPAVSSPESQQAPPSDMDGEDIVPPSQPAGEAAPQGYWEDDVDHQARETYELCYAMPAISVMHEMFMTAFRTFEDKLNFKLLTSSSDSNNEVYLQNLEVMASRGVDGFFVDSDQNISVRVKEVLEELGVPYVCFVQIMLDAQGHMAAPAVVLNGYDCGVKQADWFYANYRSYWPDVADTDIAYLDLTFTNSPDFKARTDGVYDKFREYFPDNDLFFELDMVNHMPTADEAYDMVTPMFTTNPDVKYWYVTASAEMFGQGVARAAEALNMEDRVVVTSVGIDIIQTEWADGYEGCWAASLGISNYDTCMPALVGLIALCDGRATPDTLWKERAVPGDAFGDNYGIWYVETQMVTARTYRDYLDGILAKYGVPA
ncbi:MAG: hypothetical protein LBD92_02590 [Oscillospiraceae bacterium]|nr:hypothetical protein [Oscillospiraceae bacterium]